MEETTIFDFLTFKYAKRTYGKTETVVKDICKMPITLSSNNGKEVVVYLLAKYVGEKKYNLGVHTLSRSPYKNISMVENEIVCERFDSEVPTRYDANGKILNADSKLSLIELD